MPSTYLQLTNRLLRRLNEVEIAQSDFTSVRGIQATAKDCVIDAINEINGRRSDWPFNAVEHTQQLVKGTEEYGWPTAFVTADWNSFQIQKDDTLDTDFQVLKYISRDEWYSKMRDRDYNSGTDGRGEPLFVFPSHGHGWGVTPSPNAGYVVKYRYFRTPVQVSAATDQVTIPEHFNYVILFGALYHLNLFKENIEGSATSERKFSDGLKDMANVYIPNADHMESGMVTQQPYSGNSFYPGFRGF